MVKWKADNYSWNFGITRVEVARETDAFVILTGRNPMGDWQRREAKKNTYFDSWREAHEFLMTQATNGVRQAMMQLETAQAQLEKAHAMKEDDTQ